MKNGTAELLRIIGAPKKYDFEHTAELVRTYDKQDYTLEVYLQKNGPDSFQRLFVAIPKSVSAPMPCVVIPYYFPEGMLGYDPDTDEVLADYKAVSFMDDLARRGYAVASADSFHLSYIGINKEEGYKPWLDKVHHWSAAAKALLADYPEWTGLGKLIFDTSLVIDLVSSDSRIDASRIGIMGHSLGGIMSFCTGCIDKRVKVIVSSDFGMNWDRNNWHDIWYFGSRISEVKSLGLTTTDLLELAAPKPFMLFAGYYDNDESFEMMKSASGYSDSLDNLGFINHATGHRPPADVIEKGYQFLDKWLKK